MKLGGHYNLTVQAVREFLSEYKRVPQRGGQSRLGRREHARTIRRAVRQRSPGEAVFRDIRDILTLGHWANFGQKHHFMRRFDGQSEYEAYISACNWILSNSLEWANVAVRSSLYLSQSNKLGNAFHALQDSFSDGHVLRLPSSCADRPGKIYRVKRYAGADKEGHSEFDKKWKHDGKFSIKGRQANNAVKELLHIIFDAINDALDAGRKQVPQLIGWMDFKDKWLSPLMQKHIIEGGVTIHPLPKRRDESYDLVDEFYNGLVFGNSQLALSMDEERLAEEIYQRLGRDTQKVFDVFHRLDEHHTVDADDVAEYYVDILRKNDSKNVSRVLARDTCRTRSLLIKILDEGLTTEGEQTCIDFLRELKN